MKIKLFLVFVLISSTVVGQTRKGDILVSPQLFMQKHSKFFNFNLGISTSMHFFILKQVSVGASLKQEIFIYNTKDTANLYNHRATILQLLPEIQINLFNKSLTPFIKFRILEDHFYFQHQTTNDLRLPIRQRDVKAFVINHGVMRYGASVGISYNIIDISSLYGIANFGGSNAKLFFNSYGIGAQFCINRMRTAHSTNNPR